MKQFGKILSFEFKGYIKNKMFIGFTVVLVIAIAALIFSSNIAALFNSNQDGETPLEDSPIMLVYAEDEMLASLSQEYFTNAFVGYNVRLAECSIDDIKEDIASGEVECAFVMNSVSSYTYYVNNLSMNDVNVAIADAVLQEVYRANAMMQNGLTPEQVGEILSVQIESRTEMLGKNQVQNFWYTYIMIYALYMVIMVYGQMVANNVATEKSSRAMELLVTSAKPTSMMFGKVIASCLAGFSQLVIIFGTAILLYNINKDAISDPMIASIFDIPVELFIYLIVFFVLGFLTYAFLYGAIGSTVSKLEDVGLAIMPISYIFLAAMLIVIINTTSGSVDNTTMSICSYIPFTAPMAMFARICMSTVTWHEIAISIAVSTASVIGIGFAAAKIYRVGVLLYGNRPKIGEVLKMVFKKQ